MKAKKAIKRLAKAETLLADVLEQYPASKDGLRDLLDSAKTSVAQARAAIDVEVAVTPAKKAPSQAKEAKPDRLSEAGRKRISMAAKKRWAATRRMNKTA
jgi:hypothetical protein